MADGDNPGEWASLETSPEGQFINRVCRAILDMSLADIEGNVWIRDLPILDDGTKAKIPAPCIILSNYAPEHDPAAGTTSAPDLTVNVMVGIYTGGNRASASSLPERLFWRHKLFSRFAKQGCPFGTDSAFVNGVQCIACNVSPGDVRVIEAWRLLNADATWITVRGWLRYPGAA